MPCNCTKTHWNSSNQNTFFYVFLLFYANLTILICLYLKFRFYIISATSCCFQIWRLDKLVTKGLFFVIFRVYLSLLNSSSSIISFFCSLLIKLLLLPFCNICYGTFLRQPALFWVSIDNFKHFLYAVLLSPSLNGLDKCTWLSPFE